MAVEKILVPDLGTDEAVEVIEVLVKVGDSIEANASVAVLESDKAAMEVPASKGGVIKEVLVKVGSQVKTGSELLILESADAAAAPAKAAASAAKVEAPKAAPAPAAPKAEAPASSAQSVSVPDLGGAKDVDVIDILVKVGDTVKKEDGLITLETDTAAMEVPAPFAGKISAIKVKVGDKVSQGSLIVEMEVTGAAAASAAPKAAAPQAEAAPAPAAAQAAAPLSAEPVVQSGEVYAGPAVRKLARELGVDLSKVKGSGLKGRLVKEDLHAFVKAVMQGSSAASGASVGGSGIPPIADLDFSKFGPIEEVEMTKLHRLTAQNMARNWLNVPHVTQFDEADITDLEAFRNAQKALADKKGIKLTPLPFIVKACAQALKAYPQFNVSLHSSGSKLIQKKYVHIGVAVATPAGLMVPVVRDADKKSIWQIASEVAALGAKAKDRKLTKEDMEGACFTISSLGNIGGTGFTPIVNAPEVAILGVSRAAIKPVWNGKEFAPRNLLPYSLSYDHRAVNGADAGAFCTYLGQLLSDIRLMVL
ncbi:MAG: dihydrolipoyllysine-residue acetyltransferase [Pseudomonadales bacterium]|nr:dihydrolipoyllysine-residue acetyltransferase [Pseudomonadales bacterium]